MEGAGKVAKQLKMKAVLVERTYSQATLKTLPARCSREATKGRSKYWMSKVTGTMS